jgi:hypothetical protein
MAGHPLGQQCTATSKQTGERCRCRVIGVPVCYWHGGSAPQVRARREARLVEFEARLRGEPLEDRDPAEQLLAAAREADRMAQRLRRALDERGGLDAASLTALGEWLDRVGRLSRAVIDTKLDERQVRLAERYGDMVAGAIEAILADLSARLRLAGVDAGVVDVQWPGWVAQVVPRRSLELTAGGGGG